jgi:hypothetical protein
MENERVIKIYELYKKSSGKYGKKVSFPKARDITKTYTWRYFKNFSESIDELEIDNNLIGPIISTIVKYAYDNNLLNKGASVLNRKGMIELALSKLESEVEIENKIVEEIEKSQLFLERQQNENNKNLKGVSLLLDRKKRFGYSNIVSWYESEQLSKAFIALSKACGKATSKLPEEERQILPSNEEIIIIRCKCLHKNSLGPQIKQLLKNDLALGGT